MSITTNTTVTTNTTDTTAPPAPSPPSAFNIPHSAFTSKSLRPIFDNLAHAGHNLDDILHDLDLSKDETESLLASQKFRTHRQLRTQLLAQQLQLAAQDHAQFALHRLLALSESPHPAVARLAATQILAYAGLTPPTPYSPRLAGGNASPTDNFRNFSNDPPPAPTQNNSPAPEPQTQNRKSKIENRKFLAPSLLALLVLLLAVPFHPSRKNTFADSKRGAGESNSGIARRVTPIASRMRIAFLTHQWPGVRLGGIGAYTLNAALALAEAGHEPHVFTFTLPEDVRADLPGNFVVHEVGDLAQRTGEGTLPAILAAAIHAGGEGMYRLALGALLCDEVRKLHAALPLDVVEAPEYEALGLPLLLSPIEGVRTVTHLHSGSAIAHQANKLAEMGATGERRLMEATEFAAMLAADAVVAPSGQVVSDTREFCPIETAEVLPLPFFSAMRGMPSPPPAEGPILFIGRLEIVKGAHLLPAALNIFLQRFPSATVRLIGPDTASSPAGGSMAQWIRSQLDPKIAARVAFVGELSREGIVAELAAASFVVAPSLHDSYSYVCCDALAAGRPVIVSEGIGATEVVGDAGLTFKRGNASSLATAMAKLQSDPGLLRELGGRAVRRAQTVLADTGRARVAFYERLIEGGAGKVSFDERLAKLPAVYVGPLVQALGRLTMFLAGAPDRSIRTPGTRLSEIMDAVGKRANGPAKIMLYGAGRHTSRLLAEQHLWEGGGHRVVGLIDDHPRFQSQKTHLGIPVESLAEFLARVPIKDPALAVVLSTDTFQDQFWEQTEPLRKVGVPVYRLDCEAPTVAPLRSRL